MEYAASLPASAGKLRSEVKLGEMQHDGVAPARVDGNGVAEVAIAFGAEELRIFRPAHAVDFVGADAAHEIVICAPSVALVVDERHGLSDEANGPELSGNAGNDFERIQHRRVDRVEEPQLQDSILVRTH